MGQYVLTYVYQGHLQAEMVAVLVDTHGALGLGWTRARQAGHYPTLQRVVESALHPNSLLYCQLVLPEYLGLDKVCGRRGWGGVRERGERRRKKGEGGNRASTGLEGGGNTKDRLSTLCPAFPSP